MFNVLPAIMLLLISSLQCKICLDTLSKRYDVVKDNHRIYGTIETVTVYAGKLH